MSVWKESNLKIGNSAYQKEEGKMKIICWITLVCFSSFVIGCDLIAPPWGDDSTAEVVQALFTAETQEEADSAVRQMFVITGLEDIVTDIFIHISPD